MNRDSKKESIILFLLIASALSFLGTAQPPSNKFASLDHATVDGPEKKGEIVSLRDFTKEEVRGVGITLSKDLRVHISAVGGGDKSFWSDAFSDNDSQSMFAAGWILDADTREIVWDMTMDNTSGRANRRTCEKDLTLKKGSYEVYFSAYGYVSGGTFSHISINIDRRKTHRTSNKVFGGLLGVFGVDDQEFYDEFMDNAKDVWGITLSVPDGDAAAVQTFEAPKKDKRVVVAATHLGDEVVWKKNLKVDKDVKVHIYAVGEGRRKDDVFDFGWLVNADTRERVWDMNVKDVEYAGGGSKNVKYDGDVTLTTGMYELYFVTDPSHSNDDWNARPPYDPFNYGVTISVVNDGDKDAVKTLEPSDLEKNVVVKLTEMRDDDYKSAGFSLRKESKLRIYALGESVDNNRDMADYGWIVDAKSHERVWTMSRRDTYHAGGASKNRLADELITLPKGDYIAYFQTDGSHSYSDWNSDPPFDPEHWGLTILGAGSDFDAKAVSAFSEENEEGIVAQLIRVRDDKHVRQKFSLPSRTKVRIYAIGEADGDEMADYGWIENAESGETVWKMEYDKTSWAGGAKKNRVFDKTITLNRGEYELNYKTDGSHAYNDWNDDPPEDRTHWGITIYKSQ
jgi:hypothetical protein